MLSKTSIVILGLIWNEDLSAYDMLKRINHMNMKYWWPIGNTTLYETAIRLEKKNLIIGTENGSKTIYQITESGRATMTEAICTIFKRIDFDTNWFSIAVLYCRVLEDAVLDEIIQNRRVLLNEFCHGIKTNLEHHKENQNVPYESTYAIERMLNIIELEQKELERLENGVMKKGS